MLNAKSCSSISTVKTNSILTDLASMYKLSQFIALRSMDYKGSIWGATWQLLSFFPVVSIALLPQIEIHIVCSSIWGITTAQAVKSPSEKNAVINIF